MTNGYAFSEFVAVVVITMCIDRKFSTFNPTSLPLSPFSSYQLNTQWNSTKGIKSSPSHFYTVLESVSECVVHLLNSFNFIISDRLFKLISLSLLKVSNKFSFSTNKCRMIEWHRILHLNSLNHPIPKKHMLMHAIKTTRPKCSLLH